MVYYDNSCEVFITNHEFHVEIMELLNDQIIYLIENVY